MAREHLTWGVSQRIVIELISPLRGCGSGFPAPNCFAVEMGRPVDG